MNLLLFRIAEGTSYHTFSIVAFTENGERKVGDPAKSQADHKPNKNIFIQLNDLWVTNSSDRVQKKPEPRTL
jgi:molecular chaperone DnaK (HSP70)